MSDAELRALAKTAVQSPRTPLDLLVPWVGDLAALPMPGGARDRLVHDGLVAWDDGWHLTEAGQLALRSRAP